MITDKFWKLFWLGSGSAMLIGIVLSASLFIFYTRQGDLLASVGVSYEEGKDPFAGRTLLGLGGGKSVSLSEGYLYQNALPFYFQSWTWEATVNWRSAEIKKEGSHAFKATFIKPGGSVGISGPNVDIKNMQSISLSIYPDGVVEDLYLNVYGKDGNSLGSQSLAWYTPTSTLISNTWNDVVLPLSNFIHAEVITGFSVSTKNPGVAYIDNVQLSKKSAPHGLWIAPPEQLALPFNPFATSTPLQLPYVFQPTQEFLSRWYSYFGVFAPNAKGEIEAGPSELAKTNGSLTILRAGRFWSDYRVDATLNWGQVSVFSLLARFVSDGDFVSCAFSRYGETAQLYHVKGGTSTFISQTPPLAVKDFEPWVGVNVGIEVEGNRVACFINGAKVLTATLPQMEARGTVGLETWDPNPASAPHNLTSFSVSSLTGE